MGRPKIDRLELIAHGMPPYYLVNSEGFTVATLNRRHDAHKALRWAVTYHLPGKRTKTFYPRGKLSRVAIYVQALYKREQLKLPF